jgi:ATP-binding cassette subfamily B multidrug efflux pump
LLRPIINEYILPADFAGLVRMLGILVVIYLVGIVAVYVEYRLLNKIGQQTVARMRADLFRKMEHLPVGYFDMHQHGDLMSRFTNDMDRISDALTDSLSDMLSSALTVVGIFDVGDQSDTDIGYIGDCTFDVFGCPGYCPEEPEIF